MNRLVRNLALLVMSITVTLSGCGSTGRSDDEVLEELASLDKQTIFDRAEALYTDKKYVEARKYFSFVYDTFPNDPLGHKAALRVADTYLAKKDATSLTEARLRYRDFANRYPNDPDRDYALLMVGHTYSSKKIRADRDLANLREAFTAYEQLTALYPNSRHAEEARTRTAALRDTLAEHEWLVAQFYFRNKRWQGALWRLEYLRENYPDYSRIAEVNSMVDEINRKIGELEETYRKLLEERRQSQER